MASPSRVVCFCVFIGGILILANTATFAQNSNPWPTSGSVGIGTSSPSSNVLLHTWFADEKVHHRLALSTTSYVDFRLKADSEFRINSYDGTTNHAPFIIGPSPGSNLLVLKSGKVGIGISSPQTLLHLNATNADADLTIAAATAGYAATAIFKSAAQHFNVKIRSDNFFAIEDITASPDRTPFVIEPNAGDHLLYLKAGKVGIGTTAPAGVLDVSGEFYTDTGGNSIVLREQNTGDEGGQLQFDGAGANRYFQFDNFQGNLRFISQDASGASEKMRILNDGTIGIATTTPDPNYKLSVNGKIRAKEVVVETDWPDFVFAEDYKLPSLAEVEHFIKKHKHLPDIPSQQQVADQGVNLGEMQAKLLQKIEELTLHMIELKKENQALQKRLDELEAKEGEKLK